jgi:hypothetical protein
MEILSINFIIFMQKNTYIAVSACIFLIVGIIHVIRAVGGWDIIIGSVDIPGWLSWIACIVAFTLSYFGFKYSKKVAI